MPVYKNILVTVDLGDHSAQVLQQAAALAQLCDAELSVLHVVNYTLASDMDYEIPSFDENESKLIKAAENQLNALLEREALTVGVGKIIKSGRPKIEILRVADMEKMDLIVIGAHGRHGLVGMLGSTADRVLNLAHCNVLVVH